MACLEVPTRFVWGDQDRVAAFRIGDELARRMSDGELTVIKDAGQMPQLDQPEAVAVAVNPELQASEQPQRRDAKRHHVGRMFLLWIPTWGFAHPSVRVQGENLIRICRISKAPSPGLAPQYCILDVAE